MAEYPCFLFSVFLVLSYAGRGLVMGLLLHPYIHRAVIMNYKRKNQLIHDRRRRLIIFVNKNIAEL
jgi:hypothetical protein